MKNRTKRLALVAALLLVVCLVSVSVFAADEYSEGYFKYLIEDESITITSYFGSESEVVIPDHIASLLVTRIRGSAFARNSSIAVLTVPDTVTEVGDGLFTQMKGLKKIILQSKSIAVTAPDGCVIVEDYPVYVNPDDQNRFETDVTTAAPIPPTTTNSGDDVIKNPSDGTAATPSPPANSGNVGFEVAGGDEDDDRTKIPTKDNGYITVDGSGNLIFVDGDNNLAIIDRSGGYAFSSDGSIIDASGKRVGLDEDGNTVSFVDGSGNTVTKKLDEVEFVTEKGRTSETTETTEAETTYPLGAIDPGDGSGARTAAIIAVVVAIAAVVVVTVIVVRKRKNR